MDPWLYVAAPCAVVVFLVCLLAIRAGRRRRAELQRQLMAAREDVLALTRRLDELTAHVEEQAQAHARYLEQLAEQSVEPHVITELEATPVDSTPREAKIVQAIESGRPEWVPARPLRESLIKTVALAHGVRRALSPDNRDRIRLEMQAEVRRSRRLRRAELKAVRRYLRDRRHTAA